jgi:nuclear mRNA export protein PCID2/THP1
VLAKVALGLDKSPELVAEILKDQKTGDPEGAAEKVTFVETTANVLREAFIKCITDKSGGGGGRRATPENKRTGIYMTANSCLKLLFQCRKSRNAQQIFSSIDAQSPLLSHYPASQRVTYLYYLGRYMFANSHFYRAQLALDSAYQQCHSRALRQRKLILTYLIASNICLGRFPSSKLLLRREASDLAKRFLPLCRAIARGDLAKFRRILSVDSEHGQWFLQKRMLLQLRGTCEILVWRSLARKVFILIGFLPQGDDNKMPFLRLSYVQAAVRWLEEREDVSSTQGTGGSFGLTKTGRNGHHNSAYVDQEFDDLDEAVEEHGFDLDTGSYHDQHSDDVNGHVSAETEMNGTSAAEDEESPTMAEVESIMASMLQQGLLNGFLTHTNPRFAVPGSKAGGGALKVAFPTIWQTISTRSTNEVPGWVKD